MLSGRRANLVIIGLIGASVLAVGCEDMSVETEPAATSQPDSSAAAAPESSMAAEEQSQPSPPPPTPHPPVVTPPGEGTATVQFDAANRATLEFTRPESWHAEPPSSSMRVAQYVLRGEAGDATTVVFFFGNLGAGSVDANIERWCRQFQVDGVDDPRDAATITEREVNGMTVHEIDLAGTYVAETRPGSGVRVNEPGWRLRGSIIMAEEGPYYVKCVGPDATVTEHGESLVAFVDSAR